MPRARKKAGATSSAAVQVGTAAADTFKTTIGALRADLEMHRHRVVEIEALIERLTRYAASGKAPAPANGRRHRHTGTPPDVAAKRAKARAKQARWRARAKAAAAAATAPAPPKAKRQRRKASVVGNPDAPQDQPHGGTNMSDGTQVSARDTEGELDVLRKVFDEEFERIFEPEPKLEEPIAVVTSRKDAVAVAVAAAAAVAPPPAVVPKPPKRTTQKRAGWTPDSNAWRQPETTLTEFVADEAGVLCRERVTAGSRPVLQDERPQL